MAHPVVVCPHSTKTVNWLAAKFRVMRKKTMQPVADLVTEEKNKVNETTVLHRLAVFGDWKRDIEEWRTVINEATDKFAKDQANYALRLVRSEKAVIAVMEWSQRTDAMIETITSDMKNHKLYMQDVAENSGCEIQCEGGPLCDSSDDEAFLLHVSSDDEDDEEFSHDECHEQLLEMCEDASSANELREFVCNAANSNSSFNAWMDRCGKYKLDEFLAEFEYGD